MFTPDAINACFYVICCLLTNSILIGKQLEEKKTTDNVSRTSRTRYKGLRDNSTTSRTIYNIHIMILQACRPLAYIFRINIY